MRASSRSFGSVRSAHGFTLVEVLVAIVIMSVIALMCWQGVDGIVRTRSIAQGRLEKMQRVNTALSQWKQDLNAVRKTSLERPRDGLEFTGSQLFLTRETPEGMQVVVWSLRSGNLQRWAGPSVTTLQALREQWDRVQRFVGNEAGQLRMFSGVSELQLYFNNEGAWSNAQSDSPPPQGVRLVLSFSGADGIAGQITHDVYRERSQ